MSSDALTISVESLGKRYDIYASPADRLKQMLLPRLARLAGRTGGMYYEEFWALRDVSFSVRRGETVGIVGRNGSGKSTLLQMICGTLHPTEGAVSTHGRVAALLELGAGFNPEFTGEENVYLSGLLYGIPEKELRKRFDSIVAFAEIGEFIHQPVKTYSSGMYVRLAFAVAAHVDADVLIIDEALSVGDVRFTQKCMRFLRDFQQRGTLLFVSHDTSAVTNLCSRAVWLDAGRLVMDGAAGQVVEEYLAAQHAADRALAGDVVRLRRSGATDGASAQAASRPPSSATPPVALEDVRDSRQDLLNGTGSRNLVAIFEFDASRVDREFGAGAARIVDVRLSSLDRGDIAMVQGGEIVELVIKAVAEQAIASPIFGFHVKDRLGQQLFGDNTYLSYHDNVLKFAAGQTMRARFRFRMPVLPNGDYSVDVALATGSQEEHTQQHWIHDALQFKSSVSTMRHGLVGIPMHSIDIVQGGG
ncbi:ABC transporter ATP-binding protein [Fulvimonas sp. R45]|uniref:ABC transporter ATP-binding protein n=1 Tax=Fulvimonas sp. R45 TaxID=3045937 RepID=UPI00265DE0B7|nr:ABC transporter ATP-binding protein [Fulvimonas sp. R45]MDO1527634.1 ABC transporter ATP-binding protein [Fulvimonas sp. R45]